MLKGFIVLREFKVNDWGTVWKHGTLSAGIRKG